MACTRDGFDPGVCVFTILGLWGVLWRLRGTQGDCAADYMGRRCMQQNRAK